jgi:uncharacterized coiled-coil protein SlyX
MPEDDARLVALETALAHQERLGDELSDLLRAQAARLDRLERLAADLAGRLAALELPAAPPADTRPPHW